MRIEIPAFSVVALVGVSGAGKSTFARQHFGATEVLSSDHCRALVCDDEGNQSVTRDAFEILYLIAAKRLAGRRLTVLDATNVNPEDRRHILKLAAAHDCAPVAIALDLPLALCAARNTTRPGRNFSDDVHLRQRTALERSLDLLAGEGFQSVHVLRTVEEVLAATIVRRPLAPDRRDDGGPFDVIGDVRGRFEELCELLEILGYALDGELGVTHPAGRKPVFLGNLGGGIVEALAQRVVGSGRGLWVPSPDELRTAEASHYVLDGGRLVVVHSGIRDAFLGRVSPRVAAFATAAAHGWASDWKGPATVVHGNGPVPRAEWIGNTICVDTGCGLESGRLTALRYPEKELVSSPSS